MEIERQIIGRDGATETIVQCDDDHYFQVFTQDIKLKHRYDYVQMPDRHALKLMHIIAEASGYKIVRKDGSDDDER